VQRIVMPSQAHPNLDSLPADGLQQIFKDVFDETPPDYGATEAVGLPSELSINSLKISRYRVARSRSDSMDRKQPRMTKMPGRNWDVYLARRTPAKLVGTVEANDADTAIEKAAMEFEVKDPKRLIAVKRSAG